MNITFVKQNKRGQNYYYSVHDRQKSLFAEYILVTAWGADIAHGREKTYVFSKRTELDRQIRKIFKARIRDGYKVLYSFARKEAEKKLVDQVVSHRIG